ncbi:unnamed protein product [Ixodes pacificus]
MVLQKTCLLKIKIKKQVLFIVYVLCKVVVARFTCQRKNNALEMCMSGSRDANSTYVHLRVCWCQYMCTVCRKVKDARFSLYTFNHAIKLNKTKMVLDIGSDKRAKYVPLPFM